MATDDLQQIKSILESKDADLYHLIEAESIYNEQLIRLKQSDIFEDHSTKQKQILDLKTKIRTLQLENDRTQINKIDGNALFELTGIESTGTMENSNKIEEMLIEKIKNAEEQLAELGPSPIENKKGKKNDRLMIKRVVMNVQSQVKDYDNYKRRRQQLKKMAFGLQCVYNDLSFILQSAKTYEWAHWHGFDLRLDENRIGFFNLFTNIEISFTLEGDGIKMEYNGVVYDSYAPYYEHIADMLNFPAPVNSTQKMDV